MSEESAAVFALMQGTLANVDAQFETWLTISFALVVAAFFSRGWLAPAFRRVLAALYLMSTLVIVLRLFQHARTGMALREVFGEMTGLSPYSSSLPVTTGAIRLLTILVGTIATLYFVLNPHATTQLPGEGEAESQEAGRS